ncbi:MAG: LPS assembly protein LptD [Holosporales bacterium]|nr:LPS assembly protein LptD [Holosporales bacterium]
MCFVAEYGELETEYNEACLVYLSGKLPSKSIAYHILKLFFFVLIICNAYSEVSIQSRRVSYDLSTEIICAAGDVVVIQEYDDGKSRKLYTDEIEYNRKTGTIKLHGKAILEEPTGEVIAATTVVLDPGMENAIAKALVIILDDAAKVKAKTGTKVGSLYTFEDASYSPCNETHCSVPLWDLFADKVTYDSKGKSFVYHNVRLRFKGLPIIFSPYFKHPGFGVRRQTGFLSPIIRSNNDIGLFVGTPYFMVIDKNRDLKVTPFINFKGRGLASSEYRQSLANGDVSISSSVLTKARANQPNVNDLDKKTRWHFDSVFKSFNLDQKRVTFRLNRASDVTYKLKYPVDEGKDSGSLWRRRCNESRLSFESFDDHYYVTTESLVYQTPNKDTAPIILPHVTLSHRTDDVLNGTVELDSDTVYLIRKNPRENQKSSDFSDHFFRTTSKVNWKRNVTIHHVSVDFSSGVRGDILHVGQHGNDTKCTDKIYPTIENQVSGFMPFISNISSLNSTSIWGPRITLSSVESIGNRKDVFVNEDSIFHNIDDLRLHQINGFGAFNNVEEGEHVSVGIENSIYNDQRRYLNFFIGSSQSIREKNKVNNQEEGNSIVGRLVIKPCDNASFRMRFVGLPIMEKARMFETGVKLDAGYVSANIGYVYDTRSNAIREGNISQIGFTVSVKLTKYWNISGSKIININKKLGGRNLLSGIFAEYKDECFGFGIGFHKSNFKDKDIRPNVGIAIVLTFKNLGNISNPVQHYLYNSELGNVE